MDTIFKLMRDELGNIFGKPFKLIDIIKDKELTSEEIDYPCGITDSVIDWTKWSRTSSHCIHSVFFSELNDLVVIEKNEKKVEIQEIKSFLFSKTDFSVYTNFEDAAKACTPDYIKNMTVSGLESSIDHLKKYAWKELYINLDYYSWYDKNYLWCNADGSHHFVAAKYIAKTINEKVYKNAIITSYKINQDILRPFLTRYDMFTIKDVHSKLYEALEHFDCKYYLVDLPYPLSRGNLHTKILVLPKNYKRNANIAKILSINNFTSWNEFMKENLS